MQLAIISYVMSKYPFETVCIKGRHPTSILDIIHCPAIRQKKAGSLHVIALGSSHQRGFALRILAVGVCITMFQ